MKRIITFGTFDLLHVGHLRILERAKSLGDHLTVGVSTDNLNASKGKYSVFSQEQRLEYIKALAYVDEVFFEESLEKKNEYIKKYNSDLLVMGNDWEGMFDWVSCETLYLERTPGLSSTQLKTAISERNRCKKILFGDTYVRKHYDCALSILNEMTDSNIAPIFTSTRELPPGIDCDCIVYFNLPAIPPPEAYSDKPRILLDHGASTLKWFLANQNRYNFFDHIITAGPDHVRALTSFFPADSNTKSKVKSGGFIKSNDILSPSKYTRFEICEKAKLQQDIPIILFAPTWHINANRDMSYAINEISQLDNVVTSLHPETAHLDVSALNVIDNINGMTVELLKHADIVISDTSSTLYEAAALRKKTVQIAMREYSDNNSLLFDFPYVAGTSELFCGGIVARPNELKSVVHQLLANNEALNISLNHLHDRVLHGTIISKEATSNIVEELLSACTSDRRNSESDNRSLAAEGLKEVHENMFFAANRVIAHGGGDYDQMHASNSIEAIRAASDAIDFIEIDIVMGKDGLLVAHDTFEERYGLATTFDETTVSEFSQSRYMNSLTPVKIEDVFDHCQKTRRAIVCDIKGIKDQYQEVAQKIYELGKEKAILDRLVVQCYSQDDFEFANNLGFRRIILAVWKFFYKDPIGDESFHFISKCLRINADSIVGISIPSINKHMDTESYNDERFDRWLSFWKRIYIHGAPKSAYPDILRKNLGVFADGISEKIEFKDFPFNFDWKHYLFLNPGLVDAGIDNQISATKHYVEFGQDEKRVSSYQTPPDFIWARYVDKNPALRKNGISGVNSASAHWTKYGQHENRDY